MERRSRLPRCKRCEGLVPRYRCNSNADAATSGTKRRDHSERARQSLRNTNSRVLVNTIENVIKQGGGVAPISERFLLDSDIGRIWGENITNEIAALTPLPDEENPNGTGQAALLAAGRDFPAETRKMKTVYENREKRLNLLWNIRAHPLVSEFGGQPVRQRFTAPGDFNELPHHNYGRLRLKLHPRLRLYRPLFT